jgi:hypothetical protein
MRKKQVQEEVQELFLSYSPTTQTIPSNSLCISIQISSKILQDYPDKSKLSTFK